jgi:hypothetical protein
VARDGTVLRPVRFECHGHRSGLPADPSGYSWFVASKAEDVAPTDMQRRRDAMAAPARSVPERPWPPQGRVGRGGDGRASVLGAPE